MWNGDMALKFYGLDDVFEIEIERVWVETFARPDIKLSNTDRWCNTFKAFPWLKLVCLSRGNKVDGGVILESIVVQQFMGIP